MSENNSVLMEVKNINLRFGGVVAIQNVSFDIFHGLWMHFLNKHFATWLSKVIFRRNPFYYKLFWKWILLDHNSVLVLSSTLFGFEQ